MLHSHLSYGNKTDFLPLIAADAPVSRVPDLPPIIHDFERNRARNKQRQQKKHPEPPPEQPKTPDSERHVDEYA